MPRGTPLHGAAPLALCTLVLAAGSEGCSYTLVDGPPASHRQLNYFTCTSGNALPTTDVVLSAIFAVDTIAALGLNSHSEMNSTSGAVALAGGAVLFAASAVSGYGRTSACRDATAELQGRLARMPAMPGLGPGQQGLAPYQPPTPYDPWVTAPAGGFGMSPSGPAPPPSAPPPPADAGAPPSPPDSIPPPAPEPQVPGEER